ncbi:unnamed protein product, partial [Lampetra fluviatilis]
TVTGTAEKVCYLLSYHVSLVMLLWAFFQTVFTPVRRPSKEFSLCKAERQALEGDDADGADGAEGGAGGGDGGGGDAGGAGGGGGAESLRVDVQRELLRRSAHSLPLATCTESG